MSMIKSIMSLQISSSQILRWVCSLTHGPTKNLICAFCLVKASDKQSCVSLHKLLEAVVRKIKWKLMVYMQNLLHSYFCAGELATFVLKNEFGTCLKQAYGCSGGSRATIYPGYFWLILYRIIFFNPRILSWNEKCIAPNSLKLLSWALVLRRQKWELWREQKVDLIYSRRNESRSESRLYALWFNAKWTQNKSLISLLFFTQSDLYTRPHRARCCTLYVDTVTLTSGGLIVSVR